MTSVIFTDEQKQDWSFRIDVPLSRKLKEQGFDLMNSSFLEKLFGDPIDIIEFAAKLCEQQCEARNIDFNAFVNRCTEGDETYLRVRKTLEASIADFFRRLGETQRAEMIQKIAATADAARMRMLEKVRNNSKVDQLLQKSIDQAEKEFDDKLDAALAQPGD